MRVAKSTGRALTVARDEPNPGPDEETLAANRERVGALTLIVGRGCNNCCGAMCQNQDGSRIECPLLHQQKFYDRMTDEQRRMAEECTIPEMYAAVHDGKRGPVTVAEVHACVPPIFWTAKGVAAEPDSRDEET